MEAVEPPGVGNEARALRLERLPHGPVRELGMTMRLGVCDRLVEEPRVQFLIALARTRGVKNRSRTSPTWFST